MSVAFTKEDSAELRRRFCYPTARFHLIGTSLRKRQTLSGERLDYHMRDELLREMIRTVVVRAIGDDRRQVIGFTPCTDHMI